MSNKNKLQLVGGLLTILAFFVSWVASETGNLAGSPMQYVSAGNNNGLFTIYYIVMLLAGVANFYLSLMKKYNYAVVGTNIVIIAILAYYTIEGMAIVGDMTLYIGFYLAMLSGLTYAVSILTSNQNSTEKQSA